MNMIVLAIAVLGLGVTAGHAFAESEGAGDPFAFRIAGPSGDGRAFVQDIGQEVYPNLTGKPAQPSSLAQLEPAFGHEAPVQTAASLPRGFGDGTVAYAQTQTMNRYLEAQIKRTRVLEAGIPHPRG